MGLMNRLAGLFRRSRLDQDLNEELQHHIELKTREYIEAGMSPEEARYTAVRAFGGIEQKKEQCRDADRLRWVEDLIQDLRYGLRQLRRNPGFAAVAVITLALGIGANTAIFSVVNGVLLNPLPYAQPDQLVALYSRDANSNTSSISYPNFLDWIRGNRSFSALAAYRSYDFDLTGEGEPERVPAEMISANFFPMLGVKPVLGRTFLSNEDQEGARPVVLISGGLWKRKFGSSPDAVGRTLTLNGVDYTIVGVIPSSFYYINGNFHRSDVYVPIGQSDEPAFRDRRESMGMDAVGRLNRGITFEQAKADMDALGRHLAEVYPEADKGTGITLVPLKKDAVGDTQPFLLVLLAAVGFVLLIACVNVANLMLARSTGRTREFAIRSALGAGRRRVMRQLLTESVLLALAGGGLGLLVATWGLQAALKVLPEALPRAQDVHLDGRVLLFTLAASMLAGILFGLAPANEASQTDIQETLKEGGRGSSHGRHRAQNIFVVVEMALTLSLLVGAGLMIRSLVNLWGVDPGFDPHNVLSFHISFPMGAENPDAIRATLRGIHDQLAAIPGVQAVALTAASRPMRNYSNVPFWLAGQPKPSTQANMKQAMFYLVQPDYLKVMRTPLERGRFLTSADSEHSPLVTVIDDRFAQLYFHGQDPIGKRINFDILNMKAEIVGIVGHVKQGGLDSDSTSSVQAQCYLALPQLPDKLISTFRGDVAILLRTTTSPLAQAGSIRQAIHRINSGAVMYDTETMDSIISSSLAARRFSMILLSIFAGLALIMASIGIYGVISYMARQRAHEIGIRMALGAEKHDILRMVIGQGLKLVLIGVAIGIVGALGLTRFLSSLLYGVKRTDPVTFIMVSLVLTGVALVACYIPARRATKVDPVIALRHE
jgi:predicted permease